jgi:hypothetical protein
MSEPMNCPKCDADISDTYEPDDWSCGISEGWYCDACDLAVAGWEHPREPLEGDIGIPPSRDPSEPIGAPISEVAGRAVAPDHPDYGKFLNFKRIAKSWGFD